MIKDLPFVKEKVSLAKYTWFQVGGCTDFFVRPQTSDELKSFLLQKDTHLPLTILGAASNVLIRDQGIEGAVLKLGKGFNTIEHHQEEVLAGAACLDRTLAAYAGQHGIGNLEFLLGIPGSLGGAVAMNAGCYEGEIKDIFLWAEGMSFKGKTHRFTAQDLGFQYRSSLLPEDIILTKICLKGRHLSPSLIHKKMLEIEEKRKEAQPLKGKTGGSTFKNPKGHYAWQLIDRAGCRGLRLGGAQVSEKHCNFLLNLDNATANDIETLGELVKNKVEEHTGVSLEWEIKRIGNKNPL